MRTRKVQIQVEGMKENQYLEAGEPNWWAYWFDDSGNLMWVIPRGIPAREPLDLEVEVPWDKKIIVGAGPRQYPGVRYTF